MIAAMLSIPLVDGVAKHLSVIYSPLFIGWVRFMIATVLVLPIAAAVHGKSLFPSRGLAAHGLRTLFFVVAMTLYFFAIARIPLATAASAYFIGPVAAVVLAIVVLGEKLTRLKMASVGLGFIGSLVILQPGSTADPGILLAFGAGIVFACYLTATRQASKGSAPLQTLAFQCAVGAVLLTPQGLATWSTPAIADLGLFLGLSVISLISHFLTIAAFRLADASTLAPLVYFELIGAAAIGYLAFDEVPGFQTLAGAALIVAAGLLLLRRPAEDRGDA